MANTWASVGKIVAPDKDVEPLKWVLTGQAGSGKTTLVLICKAFATYWFGAIATKQVALANNAARLAGGNTMHFLFKLPFKNHNLLLSLTRSLFQGALARTSGCQR